MATGRQRRWLALAAVPVGLLGAVAATGIDHAPPELTADPAPGVSQRGPAVIGRAEPMRAGATHRRGPHRPPGEGVPAGRAPDRAARARMRAAAPVARRFLAALLAFELSGVTPAVREQLRASATPALARFLTAREPRLPPAGAPPRRGRLVGLEPLADRSGRRVELAATIARTHRRSGLILVLRRGDRWRVAAMR